MKGSLVFYTAQYEAVKELTNEQLGRLYRAIFETALGNVPEVDANIKIAYNFIQNQVEIDTEKYERISKVRSEAGKKGGKSKAKQAKQANASFVKQNKLNDNVNDNDNDNVNVNDNEQACLTDDDFYLYGIQSNVKLTKEQRDNLKRMYTDSNGIIDKVSNWLPKAEKPQNDHYSLCLRFAQNDGWRKRAAKEEPKPVEEKPQDLLSPEEQQQAVAEIKAKLNGIYKGG